MEGEPGPIRFARSRGFQVAWQLFGEGPSDLVLVWGRPNHLESLWEWPSLARWLRSLGQFGRVAHLDQVGSGLSDRVAVAEIPNLDQQAADVVAVLDAAGMGTVTVIGESEGACCAVRLAASYPDRVDRLVLLAPTLRGLIPEDLRESVFDLIEERWGTPLMVELQFPSLVDDPRFADWFGRMLRRAASPREARAMLALDEQVDEVGRLSEVRVPTLVLTQADDVFVGTDQVREWANRLPNGSLVIVPGSDRTFGSGRGTADVHALRAIADFLGTDAVSDAPVGRRRRTILITDIVDSTPLAVEIGDQTWRQLLDEHDRIMTKLAHDLGGDWISSTGDGVAATLPNAANAVQMVREARTLLAPLGMTIRAGIHDGEVELRGTTRAGIDIHIAARIANLASRDQLLASKASVATLSNVPRSTAGTHQLKGVPGTWTLWSID